MLQDHEQKSLRDELRSSNESGFHEWDEQAEEVFPGKKAEEGCGGSSTKTLDCNINDLGVLHPDAKLVIGTIDIQLCAG